MEKYARQALSEGVKSDSELHVAEDSELYRVINVHYNRNNHIEVSFIFLLFSLESEPPGWYQRFVPKASR